MQFKWLTLFFLSLLFSCKTKLIIDPQAIEKPDVSSVLYQGRISHLSDSSKVFYWSGTSAKIHFESNSLSFKLKDSKGDNYYYAILDDSVVDIIKPTTTTTNYEIFKEDIYQEHSFELLKISEWTRGNTSFGGFNIGDGKYLPLSSKSHKIVYYGNSITSAYAVDDSSGDSPDSTYTNFYKSYARLTANHFNANYDCISRSGIGIMISWFDMIMPEMYNRLNPEDSLSIWGFSEDSTDVVVINLLQNDSWLVNRPNMQVFKDKFGTTKPSEEEIIEAYKSFLVTIQLSHPNASIVCMLGNMDITKSSSPWPSYVNEAVKRINDTKIHVLTVPYKNTPGHPDPTEQQLLADKLIQLIESKGLME